MIVHDAAGHLHGGRPLVRAIDLVVGPQRRADEAHAADFGRGVVEPGDAVRGRMLPGRRARVLPVASIELVIAGECDDRQVRPRLVAQIGEPLLRPRADIARDDQRVDAIHQIQLEPRLKLQVDVGEDLQAHGRDRVPGSRFQDQGKISALKPGP